MNKPYFSVIVPVYNVPKQMLDKCLKSLINQTLDDIEVIIVDDGSTDESGKICDNYAKENNNIKVVHQKNKGLCGARNTGFELSIGKYITFVDGDDWVEYNTFEILYNEIQNVDYDVVLFGTIKDYKNYSQNYNFNNLFVEKKYFNGLECKFIQQQILNFDSQLGDSTAKLYKREFLKNNNLIHCEKIRQGVEAMEFNLRVFEKVQSIIFVDKYLYHYTFNDDSITNKFDEKKTIKHLEGYRKMLDFIISKKDDELEQLLYIRMMHNIISVAVSGYFSPKYKIKYKNRKNKYSEYLKIDIVRDSLEKVNKKKLSKKYKIILYIISKKWYFMIYLLAKIRYIQKNK